jgi:hypothetical protein
MLATVFVAANFEVSEPRRHTPELAMLMRELVTELNRYYVKAKKKFGINMMPPTHASRTFCKRAWGER